MDQGILGEIEKLSQLKGINAEIILEAVKDAMLAAARKEYEDDGDLIAEMDPGTGRIKVFAVKTVTSLVANPSTEISLAQARRKDRSARIGSTVRFARRTDHLGRISAQLAKQVIYQKIREAERERVCAEFADRVNTIEKCTVKRAEGSDVIVELNGTEARMPRREQSRLESYMPGDRLRVVIKAIERSGRGPAIVASRASEELVKRLFEQEVPEIYDNTVEIRACAREAGERTKIAVKSRDRDVDAVGACVGMRGMRVQTIIRELRGEKIDIIEYLENPLEMVRWALSPARISHVDVLDPENRRMEVIVDESQLSLAIGKKGQNVRLAAKLIDWRIDIKSEDDKRREVESALAAISSGGTPVSALLNYDLSPGVIRTLVRAELPTLEALADTTPEDLLEIPGVGPELVERIRVAANRCFAQLARTVGVTPAPDLPGPDRESTDSGEEDEASAAPAVPAVLPGVPDASSAAEEDDEDIEFDESELERFARMEHYKAPDADSVFIPPLAGSGAGAGSSSEAPATGEQSSEEKNDSNQ